MTKYALCFAFRGQVRLRRTGQETNSRVSLNPMAASSQLCAFDPTDSQYGGCADPFADEAVRRAASD